MIADEHFRHVSEKLYDHFTDQPVELDSRFINKPRFVAEACESMVISLFNKFFSHIGVKDDSQEGAKSTGDFQFYDNDGLLYKVDIKTHNVNRSYNMGNIIATKKLLPGGDMDYTNESHVFCPLIFSYSTDGNRVIFTHPIKFVKLEWLPWTAIHIQNGLGHGQVQFRSNKIRTFTPDYTQTRSSWYQTFLDQGRAACERKIQSQIKMKEQYMSVQYA